LSKSGQTSAPIFNFLSVFGFSKGAAQSHIVVVKGYCDTVIQKLRSGARNPMFSVGGCSAAALVAGVYPFKNPQTFVIPELRSNIRNPCLAPADIRIGRVKSQSLQCLDLAAT
jgi:hypothetical protein